MPYPQPVADGDDGSDDASANASADSGPTPDPMGGYGLDGAGYPGWRVGDLTSGQGLLGVAAPPEDQAAAQQAGAAVNQAFAMGYGRAAQAMPTSSGLSPPTANPPPKNPLGQGISDGFVDDFKDLYWGLKSQARIFAVSPMIWALRAVPGIDPTNSMARGAVANEINTANALNTAVKTNTVPYFIGNVAGHGAAKLTQFVAADIAGGLLGPAVEAAPETLASETPVLGASQNASVSTQIGVAPQEPPEGLYEFPDQTADGAPYVGQSGNFGSRLAQHVAEGRLEPGTESTQHVPGGKTAREIAEHNRIQQLTGGQKAMNSPAVANKRDPIGPKRRPGLGITEPTD